jgi:hypothetical protein
MKSPHHPQDSLTKRWLLFFYSVPSKPVSIRMKIWRMLTKAGAVQFKGSIYILPDSDDHYEFFQWLVSSVTAMKGEAAFVRIEKIETMKDVDIIAMFNQNRVKDYQDIGTRLDSLADKIRNAKKVVDTAIGKNLEDELHKIEKDFQEVGKIDFFYSDMRKGLEKRLNSINAAFATLSGTVKKDLSTEVVVRIVANYQGRLWVTRKKPFIDRMASAWLIKRFIDKTPIFGFVEESDLAHLDKGTVAYDIIGGEFTHVGDLCTFEVLLKTFQLNDKTLDSIGEIIHQLDLHDEKYRNPAAEGLKEILDGVRRTARDDHESLEQGMNIIEMLYASKNTTPTNT